MVFLRKFGTVFYWAKISKNSKKFQIFLGGGSTPVPPDFGAGGEIPPQFQKQKENLGTFWAFLFYILVAIHIYDEHVNTMETQKMNFFSGRLRRFVDLSSKSEPRQLGSAIIKHFHVMLKGSLSFYFLYTRRYTYIWRAYEHHHAKPNIFDKPHIFIGKSRYCHLCLRKNHTTFSRLVMDAFSELKTNTHYLEISNMVNAQPNERNEPTWAVAKTSVLAEHFELWGSCCQRKARVALSPRGKI